MHDYLDWLIEDSDDRKKLAQGEGHDTCGHIGSRH
jgi:hypothetical protein